MLSLAPRFSLYRIAARCVTVSASWAQSLKAQQCSLLLLSGWLQHRTFSFSSSQDEDVLGTTSGHGKPTTRKWRTAGIISRDLPSSYVFPWWPAVKGLLLEVSHTAATLSVCALAVSGRALESFLEGWGTAGSHRKNSWRSVLTASGHSIMIMWLPSCRTFRKAIKRIWQSEK